MKLVLFPIMAGLLCCSAAEAQFSSLRSFENKLLYQPKTDAQMWYPLPRQFGVQDVWLRSADGETIHAWWFPHPQSTGALLLCHGNANNLSCWSGRVLALQKSLGQSVLIFDYPGYGKSSGKPSESGCYDAADAAYDWLIQDRKIPGKQIILYGESLGGGVATELAVRLPHRALVLVRTFTCVPDIVRKSVWTSSVAPLVHNQFDNLARIPHCTAPIFIAHGDKDTLIPLAQAVKLYQAAPQPKRGHVLKNCGHVDDLPIDFYQALTAFLSAQPRSP